MHEPEQTKRFIPHYLLKLFFYGVVFGLLPATLIGFCLYFYSYRSIMKNIRESSAHAQRQIQMRIEQTMRMQDRQLFNFVSSPKTIELLEVSAPFNEHYLLVDQVRQNLGAIQIYDLGIDDTVLISLKNNWILSMTGMSRITGMSGENHLKNILYPVNKAIWLGDFTLKDDVVPSLSNRWMLSNTIKFIRPYPVYENGILGYASISIPCSWYSQILKSDRMAEDIFVLDIEGRVAFNKQGNLAGSLLADSPYGKDFAELFPAPAGPFFKTEPETAISKKTKLVYSFAKSTYNGWVYIYITNMFTAWRELSILRNITLGIGLLTVLSVIFISYNRAHHFYRPVGQIYDKLIREKQQDEKESGGHDEFKAINTQLETILQDRRNLEEKVISQFQISQELLVHKLLNGEISGTQLDEKIEIYQFSPCPLYCRVAVVSIESLEDSGYDKNDRDWLNITICGASSDKMAGMLCFPIVIDGGDIVMILGTNSCENEFKNCLESSLKNLLESIQKNINVDAVVCVSSPVENYSMVSGCRNQAHEMLKYLIFYGQKSLLFFEEIEGPLRVYPQFPQSHEENILQAIRQGDIHETDTALESFIRIILDNENFRQYCYLAFSRLLVDIVRLSQEYNLEQSLCIKQGIAFEQLFTLKKQRQIYDWFKKNYTDPLLMLIHQRVSQGDMVLVEKMKTIAETRYTDYLSVEIIADELSGSPSYLRRIFKGGTGIAFNTYLINCRMNAAKYMLENSTEPIANIARKLTYQNSQNFIRTFKSHTGLTPGEYREMKRNVIPLQKTVKSN